MNLRRLALELIGCNENIRDEQCLMRALAAGVASSGATLLSTARAEYCPHGLTLVCFLAESHVILTTWPEYGLAVLDLLACGNIRFDEIDRALHECLTPVHSQRTAADSFVKTCHLGSPKAFAADR